MVRSAVDGGILILTASVGSGHRRAALAVASAIRGAEASESTPVEVLDLLHESPALLRFLCRDAYLGLVQRAPAMVGWLYRRFDRPSASGMRSRLLWRGLRSLRERIEASRARAIVSTHFFASEVAARMAREGSHPPLHTVVTDVDPHGLWIWNGTSRYFVAGGTGAATLERAGVPRDEIVASGIPIDPSFERPPPRAWARRVLELESDRPVVLLTTGGCCVGPIEEILRSMARLERPAQIVVICGTSERMRRRVEAIAPEFDANGGVSIRVEGFVDRMQVWMAAADLLVGKPGGLTTSECRAVGLPMVIVMAIPGQEEKNAEELVRDGAALRCGDLATLSTLIDDLLENDDRRRALSAASRAGARADAARCVADSVLNSLSAAR